MVFGNSEEYVECFLILLFNRDTEGFGRLGWWIHSLASRSTENESQSFEGTPDENKVGLFGSFLQSEGFWCLRRLGLVKFRFSRGHHGSS